MVEVEEVSRSKHIPTHALDVEFVIPVHGLNVRSEGKGVIENNFWVLFGWVVVSIYRDGEDWGRNTFGHVCERLWGN